MIPRIDATLPVVRAMLDQARRKRYRTGVLGVRAVPRWDGPETFQHDGVAVRVVPCESALAVREALLDADPQSWLVVLTDRDDADLGAGVLGHLVWHRVRNPDPWEAVTARFSASAVSAELVALPQHRELAAGFLAAQPVDGWPPAPGGVLTAAHAFAALARHHLGLPDTELDAVAVLAWTATPDLSGGIAQLRSAAGDVVVDAALGWLARQTGMASGPVGALMASGGLADALPLGVVAGLLHDAALRSDPVAGYARIRLEPRLQGRICTDLELASWSGATLGVLADTDDVVLDRVVRRADVLLGELGAAELAVGSDLVPSGLTERLQKVGTALRAVVPSQDDDSVASTEVDVVDEVWQAVEAHRLAPDDHRAARLRAAVRLVRWLARPDPPVDGLGAMVARHRDDDGWVDAAVNDAAAGVGDPELGSALGAVLTRVHDRRRGHDRQFAAALAAHESGAVPSTDVRHLEDVLRGVVVPVARTTPVLLVVVDGMSVAVATEVMRDATEDRASEWVEAALPGQRGRAAALSLLPSLTRHSRCSLLSGARESGEQDAEQRGFAAVLRASALTGALFHKKLIETTAIGMAVADQVGSALDDVTDTTVVACVLNTVDDALDRSDPAGTDWTLDTIKHLRPLVDRAARGGRTVVLTSDHGHVVERRRGTQRSEPDISSARSRGTSGSAPGTDEVLVRGQRVLAHDGCTVLAVDEDLRYGPLKAGYHGGASPAEVVVPICVLVPGAEPPDSGLRVVGRREPPWWSGGRAGAAPSVRTPVPELEADGLFAVPAPAVGARRPAGDPRVAAVLASPAFTASSALSGRRLPDDKLGALLEGLLAVPSHRLVPATAAACLDVPPARLRGALAQAQRVLNIEGYPVLRTDADGSAVLDEQLMREQFGV